VELISVSDVAFIDRAFSTLHQAYVELSMSLIESFLHEIGISQEAFAAGTHYLWPSLAIACYSLLSTSACDEGIKRGGSEAAVFSQIIAADDFLTFKRMMHARSASLDFQAHLQYEKIRNSAIPGATAAAMQSCGQHLVSRNHAEHQPTIEQHQLQHSGSFVSRSASDSPFRHSNPALQVDSKELQSGSDVEDDDERLLQQAIGETIFSMLGVLLSQRFSFMACLQNFRSLLLRKCGRRLSKRKMISKLPSV
jgi:hypothetical protein